MPNKALKTCSHYGCSKLTTGRYCDTHRLQHTRQYDYDRGSPTDRGYGSKWVAARNAYIRRNPICAICSKEGIITRATCVDHIIPHRGDMNLFWNQKNNWQSLCKSCHSRKTMKELNENKKKN